MEVMDLDVADGCLVADAATFSEEELALPDEKNQEAMVQTLRTIFQDYCQANGKISRETALQIMEQTDLQKMVDQIAVKLAMNDSDATIAELMTDGCDMGIKSLSRYLNQFPVYPFLHNHR